MGSVILWLGIPVEPCRQVLDRSPHVASRVPAHLDQVVAVTDSLIPRWVTSAERKWVNSGERRSLKAAKADGTFRKAFRRLMQPDLLVLDDAGFSTLSREKADLLFRVVSMCYREKSILVVTNLPFKQWAEFIASPAQAVAIAERLIHDASILRFSGKSGRLPRDVFGGPLDGDQ